MNTNEEPIKYFTIATYFKVLDSEMFGGKGSIGYTSACLGFENQMKGNPQDVVDISRENASQMLKVELENIISISANEYEENTEDQD